MLDVVSATADTDHLQALVGAVPDPGQGTAPPGAGRMAISHRRGGGGLHAQGLVWVLAACMLAGSASTFVGTPMRAKA